MEIAGDEMTFTQIAEMSHTVLGLPVTTDLVYSRGPGP